MRHCIRMAKHLPGPMIHTQVLLFHRIIFNHLNTFGRKVILVAEMVFQPNNMKSAGLCVIPMELFVIKMLIQIQSGGHSKRTLSFQSSCGSRYITLLLRLALHS